MTSLPETLRAGPGAVVAAAAGAPLVAAGGRVAAAGAVGAAPPVPAVGAGGSAVGAGVVVDGPQADRTNPISRMPAEKKRDDCCIRVQPLPLGAQVTRPRALPARRLQNRSAASGRRRSSHRQPSAWCR